MKQAGSRGFTSIGEGPEPGKTEVSPLAQYRAGPIVTTVEPLR
jgi:hypothetical protein